MDKVIYLPKPTTMKIPPKRVLEAAKEHCKTVLVLGYTEDDDFYFASSTGDGQDLLWLMESFKLRLLSGEFGE